MKLSRRQLRRLIAEAYTTGIPFRTAIEQSESNIERQYPDYIDRLNILQSDDPNQSEIIKSSLDQNRPSPLGIKPRPIDYVSSGVTQDQIYDVVDEFFSYDPQAYAGAMSQGGMSLRDIAEEIFDYCVTGPGIGADVLYDENGNAYDQSQVDEVIRRYEEALKQPHHRELGHIS